MAVFQTDLASTGRSDIQLWADIKEGKTQALGTLYDRYIDILYSYGARYSRSKADVMDAIHDLFLDLYKYRKKLSDTTHVEYYLLRSLRRKISKKNAVKIFPVEHPEITASLQWEKTSILSCEKQIILLETIKEKSKKLSKLMESLPKRQRKGLTLRFQQNRSYQDIAEIMKISVPTARTTIYRAIKTLRETALSAFIAILILAFLL